MKKTEPVETQSSIISNQEMARAAAMAKSNRRRKRRLRVFGGAAALVVFVTTYMLILPAITLANKPTCGLEEHTHTDECYTTERILTCGLSESAGHSHTSDCYDADGNLICGQTESEGHTHTDACYTEQQVLSCSLPEHTHTEACYPAEEESAAETEDGTETGTETATETTDQTDTAEAEEEDPNAIAGYGDTSADLESESYWESTMADVELTGNWAKDVLAIADSQLGYQESTTNYVQFNDGTIKGYSRFGAWYGSPYGDWCAMFCSFCLHYAEVPTEVFPEHSGCPAWINVLQEKGLYYDAAGYTPKAGDLIFYDWEQDGVCDHVALVYELQTQSDGSIFLKTIEGNCNNMVKYSGYQLGDYRIMGFGALPENPDYKEEDEASEEAEETEETEKAPVRKQQTAEGDDYSVTVTYDSDCGIPDNAQLTAVEYDKNSETYLQRYEAAAELYGWESNVDYSELFRLFNIGFYVDGTEIEPTGTVQVSMTFQDVEAEPEDVQIAHYADDETTAVIVEPETTEAGGETEASAENTENTENTTAAESAETQEPVEAIETTTSTEDGSTTIAFQTDSFSDYSAYLETSANKGSAAGNEMNLLAYFPFDGTLTASSGNVTATMNGTESYSAGSAAGGAALQLTGSNYLTITGSDGASLLTGYDEISFDFWMQASTNGSSNGWPVYAAPNSNAQTYSAEYYIGAFVDSTASYMKVERYKNGRKDSDGNAYGYIEKSYIASLIANQMVHVRIDYTTDSIMLHIWDKDGNQLVGGSASNSLALTDILGSSSILQIGKANWGNGEYFTGYIDELKIYGNSAYHPTTVKTENWSVNGAFLYNVDTTVDGGQPLAGVYYTVTDQETGATKQYKTDDQYYLQLTGLVAGHTYTIEQTAVPEGYTLMSQETTFTMPSGDGVVFAGYFYDYKAGDSYQTSKTAQVDDYENRVYDVVLSALSGDQTVTIDANDVSFVVDQSNSMLFPSSLSKVGEVQLKKSVTNAKRTNSNAVDAAFTEYELNREKLYYIMADDSVTATVYALWYNSSTDHWYIQDASYYAQAQNGVSGYAFSDTGNNTTEVSNTGCCIDSGVWDSKMTADLDAANGTKTYTIYQSDNTYNRLTYLKYAVKSMVYQLHALNPDTTVSVTTFDKNLESCMQKKLDSQSNIDALLNFVDGINTGGGTAQNLGLWHLVQGYSPTTNYTVTTASTKSKSFNCGYTHTIGEDDVVILITDGALYANDVYVNNQGITDNNSDTRQEKDLLEAAQKIREAGATLVTVGLSLKNVTRAQTLLNVASSGGVASEGYAYRDTQASELVATLSNALLNNLMKMSGEAGTADVTDYISDSFYPVYKSADGWVTLENGDWIALDGTKVEAGSASAAGQVHYDGVSDSWYVTWNNQTLPTETSTKTVTTPGTQTTTYQWRYNTAISTSQTFYIDSNYNYLSSKPTSSTYAEVRYSNGKWTAQWYMWTNGYWDRWWQWHEGSYSKGSTSDVTSYVNTVVSTSGGSTTTETVTNDPWQGKVYLKAKEDFIGGNTIDTNKSATITIRDTDKNTVGTVSLPTPTVNVRLLPMNAVSSEETVFLGDEITELADKIEALESQLYFSKIKNCTSAEENKSETDATDGIDCTTFTLAYAFGRELTDEEWTTILRGEAVTIPYTYDEASSHGPVGYFTIKLTENEGQTPNASDHTAEEVGLAVETYTLSVVYQAYPITGTTTETTRANDALNYGNGPGTEVGSAGTTELEDGLGTVTSNNLHVVNVVDGMVTVEKELTEALSARLSGAQRTFTFTLEMQDPDNPKVFKSVSGGSVQVTVADGSLTGSAALQHLARGTYRLVEAASDNYSVKTENVIDATNCLTSGDDTLEVLFTIGTTPEKQDVIVHNSGSGYQKVYSYLSGFESEKITAADCHEVSYATVKVVNDTANQVDYTSLSVTKTWLATNGTALPEDETEPITFEVYQIPTDQSGKSGEAVQYGRYTLNSDNSWTWSSEKLPKKVTYLEDDTPTGEYVTYTYYVQEDEVEGFTTTYTNNNTSKGIETGTIGITNKRTPVESDTELSVTKVWYDTDGNLVTDTSQKNPIQFELHQIASKDDIVVEDKVYEIEQIGGTGDTPWTWSRSDLPEVRYDDDGNRITYTYYVKELTDGDYDVTYLNNDQEKGITTGAITINNKERSVTGITVRKKWYNTSGREISNTGSVNFDLYRTVLATTEASTTTTNTATVTVYDVDAKSVYGTYTVPVNGIVTLTIWDRYNYGNMGVHYCAPSGDYFDNYFNNSTAIIASSSDAANYTKVYTYTVTADVVLLVRPYESVSGNYSISVTAPSATTVEKKTVESTEYVGSYSISSANSWVWSRSDLPASETKDGVKYTYTYYVVEHEVANYIPTYMNNNIANGVITIDNTKDKDAPVELPKTGGSGTDLFTLGGIVLMLLALVIGFSSRRRRERRAAH